jgi:uncharacterized protein (DUF433 family)
MSQVESLDFELLSAEATGLRLDDQGVVRIGKSRITLDLFVEQYETGMAPEDMVRAYDTLDLADVHAAVAFYLRHRPEVEAYLERRQAGAAAIREKLESERPRLSRDQLLGRRDNSEVADASAGK